MVAETTLSPIIRFSSFSDDWILGRLGEWLSSSRAKGHKGIPTISVTLNNGLVNRDDLKRKQETSLTAEEHLLVRNGDIAYNMMRMWQGAFGRASFDGLVSPAYVVLRGTDHVDTRFFEYAFRRTRSIYLFWAYSYGLTSDRLRLYANDFSRIPFGVPTLPEQQKIADFLTAVDGRIQQLILKKVLLEDYKKGVMQQLFSQTIRFKDDDGNDFPDWEEKKLMDCVSISMGQSPPSASYNNEQIGIPLVQGNADIKNGFTEPRVWTSQPTKECKPGDLIITVRAPVGAVSKSIHKACLGRGVASIYTNQTSNNEFIFQWLKSFEPKWKRIEQGSTFTAISGNDLRTLPIDLPHSDEQTKIANLLTAIDGKIETVNSQIIGTQTFKRGLLQQMFV